MKFLKKSKEKGKNGKKANGKEKKSTQKEVKIEEKSDDLSDYDEFLKGNTEEKRPVLIKFGKPVLQITYSTIKFLSFLVVILIIICILYSLKLIADAVIIRMQFGYYINLISKPDGEVLPSFQAIPAFIFLLLDIAEVYLFYKLFSEKAQSKINCILFLTLLVGVMLIIMMFFVFTFILSHMYSEHASLHDGMMDAMKVYANDSVLKSQIDRLQIEFQCCGSKKYDEWYELQWYDSDLVKGGNKSETSSTPFSCCSIVTIFPCIHHDIEKTGTTYLYTPEYNLSISTNGCYDMIRERKKLVGWNIIGNLFLLLLLEKSDMSENKHTAKNLDNDHNSSLF